jgi:NTE family protein
LVLGAGGFLGAAWTLGALAAVQDATGWDVTSADLMIGTSAGSVLAALLRAGHPVDELAGAHLRGSRGGRATRVPDMPTPVLDIDPAAEPSGPGLPHLGFGSLPLALRALRRPRRVPLAAVAAALLPRGRRRLKSVGAVVRDAYRGRPWPDDTLVVAMDYETGQRVAFGAHASPRSTVTRAVMASCAVPGWYEPVRIGRVPYVDGAICSPCNADLALDFGLDEIYVLVPMASLEPDRPRSALGRLERRYRRAMTTRMLDEAQQLRGTGTRVHLMTPNSEDLEAMGVNMMESARIPQVLRTAVGTARRALTRGVALDPAQHETLSIARTSDGEIPGHVSIGGGQPPGWRDAS